MKWFLDLPIRSKLFLGFGMVIALLVILTAASYRGISNMQQLQKDVYTSEFADNIDVLKLNASENGIRASLLTMMSVPRRQDKERWHQDIKNLAQQIDSLMQGLLERNRDEPTRLAKLEDLKTVMTAFRQTRENELIPMIYAGKLDRARKLALGIQAERFEKMRSITAALSKEVLSEADRHMAEINRNAATTIRTGIIIGAAAILAAFVIALFSNGIIAVPLQEISAIAEKISTGDLTAKTPHMERKDEVGRLANIFGAMVEKLQKQLRDISEAVNVLASSSTEIAATTAQLASGTEQTSVAVSETTTTVEEVKQTANVATQKARHVADLAQSAVHVSMSGSKSVNETIDGINKIREQMEYIAETIVKLSEHNQAIGEIIATVDDLSEQSNLLAVNASIEAVKAGEHGKGFIVVAQEIKSLAEQSKQATKQVRTILNDIQKASTTAVMATEKGTKSVESTVKQSAGTGDSIAELSRSISEASQAVTQIAASSQQQLVGMDQVAMAMTNIKQASVQNASSTKQVEVTVRNLQELGQKLKGLVELYKI